MLYRKYDGSLHWHLSGRLLGDDDHGVWVGCPAGTVARRGTEDSVVWQHPSVILVPDRVWWTALFVADPSEEAVYCDITSVPEWDGDLVTMVDLDLDVIRYRDGSVALDDADEFAEHRVRYAYPPEVVTNAESSAESLLAAVRAGTGPFGGAHERWLAEVGG